MPRPKTPVQTDNPIGQKINDVMAEKGIAGDYKALSQVFGIAVPSVYDYVRHGRIAKERYQALVEWSQRSLDWWFDIETPATGYKDRKDSYAKTEEKISPIASEKIADLKEKRAGQWPFSVTAEQIQKLDFDDIIMIDSYIKGVFDTRMRSIRKS